MSAIDGTFRNGKIELHGPPPADWVDGAEVSVSPVATPGEIDITGDSPEAIAAWLKWYDEFLRLPRSAEAGDELQRILDERKAENKAMWEQHVKRAEGLFQ